MWSRPRAISLPPMVDTITGKYSDRFLEVQRLVMSSPEPDIAISLRPSHNGKWTGMYSCLLLI